jgi:hypothetical protein
MTIPDLSGDAIFYNEMNIVAAAQKSLTFICDTWIGGRLRHSGQRVPCNILGSGAGQVPIRE